MWNFKRKGTQWFFNLIENIFKVHKGALLRKAMEKQKTAENPSIYSENFLSCAAAIGIVVEILFCLDLSNF